MRHHLTLLLCIAVLAACESEPPTVPNRAPTAGQIPLQTVHVGERRSLDLSGYFTDPDGDALTFTAESGHPDLVSVSVLLRHTPSTSPKATAAKKVFPGLPFTGAEWMSEAPPGGEVPPGGRQLARRVLAARPDSGFGNAFAPGERQEPQRVIRATCPGRP